MANEWEGKIKPKNIESNCSRLRERVQQQHGLAPGRVDLVPVHGLRGRAAQAEAADGREGALVPDVERVIDHVRTPQPLQVRRRAVDLRAWRWPD